MNPDIKQGHKLKEQGITQADNNAKAQWKEQADLAIRDTCLTMHYFTSDDVWALLNKRNTPTPQQLGFDPRAYAGRMRTATAQGHCQYTGHNVLSHRPTLHAADIKVYKSNTCQLTTPPGKPTDYTFTGTFNTNQPPTTPNQNTLFET